MTSGMPARRTGERRQSWRSATPARVAPPNPVGCGFRAPPNLYVKQAHQASGCSYDASMRNTKAFKTAVSDTLAELERRGVAVRPGTVADTIERNVSGVSDSLGIQVRSVWQYFDAGRLADTITQQRKDREEKEDKEGGVGVAPMPPLGNPELALLLAGVPDSLTETGGDLYSVLLNVAANAWMAGHIHGEDGCTGCEASRGPAGHNWEARMDAIRAQMPDIEKWFDSEVWNAAVQDSGFRLERR